MIKLMFSFLLSLMAISFQSVYSQDLFLDKFIVDRLIAKTPDPNLKSYQGSPYLLDSFVQGKITLTSDESFSVPLRYNLFEDLIDVRYKDREMELGKVNLIKKIEFGGYCLVMTNYPANVGEKRGFLFLLDSGKLSLLQKRYIAFEKEQPPQPLENGPTPAKFREDHVEFFAWNNRGSIYKIKSIKEIPNLVNENKSKVEEYIKQHKIKLKQDQLTRLFQYYNSL